MKKFDDIFGVVRSLMRLSVALGIFMSLVLMLKFGVIEIPNFEEEKVISEGAEEMPSQEDLPGEIGSVDPESGLIIDHGFTVVRTQCGACHSTQLVAQNRFTRDGWKDLIRWMQESQNLWDLGEQEDIILDYLAKNFAPKNTGRRKALENIEWYTLNE